MGDTEHKSGGGGGQGNQQGGGGQKKKESILDLSKYLDKTVGIKFQGGREATGILKGYDNLLNVVLDNTRYLHIYVITQKSLIRLLPARTVFFCDIFVLKLSLLYTEKY